MDFPEEFWWLYMQNAINIVNNSNMFTYSNKSGIGLIVKMLQYS